MKRDGIWGGNMEIQAFATLFSMNVVVHMLNQPPYLFTVDNPKRAVHMSYHQGQHYNSVRWTDDMNDNIPREVPTFVEQVAPLEETKLKHVEKEEEKIPAEKLKLEEAVDYAMMLLSLEDRKVAEKAVKNVFQEKEPSIPVIFPTNTHIIVNTQGI
eukprot:TRINITY_DN65088_c0_g1_i1.p4 TRINITY_DN65088_c0_g1~~TRINITY_DN65088_c0_g1_i1.p4  ORF type:complete len:156 (+),score=17.76 TRINITY_DN65088_c0_g1_i1:519-986(+)